MSLQEFAPPVTEEDERAGLKEEKDLIAHFYWDAVYCKEESEGWDEFVHDFRTGEKGTIKHPGAGRPIFKDAEFVEIRIPGNKDEIRRRQVRPEDKIRFRQQYAAFKASQEQPLSGTPIDQLTFLTASQKAEFKMMGLRTAENIVSISDVDGQKFMGFAQLRRKVADFIEASAGNAPMLKMRAEMDEKDAQLEELRQQLAELAHQVGAPAPKKRGRPAKVPPAAPAEEG